MWYNLSSRKSDDGKPILGTWISYNYRQINWENLVKHIL